MTREPLTSAQNDAIHVAIEQVVMAAACLCNTNRTGAIRDVECLARKLTAGRLAIQGNRPDTTPATWEDSRLVFLRSMEVLVDYLQAAKEEVDGTS